MLLEIKKAIIATFIAFISFNAQSEVIIDTGPTSGSAVNIFDFSDTNFQKVAGKFILNNHYAITDIAASLIYPGYDKDYAEINIAIHRDQDNLPGNQIFSGQVKVPNWYTTQDWIELSNISLSLSAGEYWVVFSGIRGEPAAAWTLFDAKNPLPSYKVMTNYSGKPEWYDMSETWNPGLKISGTLAAVPEPRSYGLLLFGLVLIGLFLRFQKN